MNKYFHEIISCCCILPWLCSLAVATLYSVCFFLVLPYPPKQLRAVSTHADSITIFWRQGFDGYSSTLGYALEISLKDSGPWRVYANNVSARTGNYTVIGLQPYTVYSARMKAFTAIGMSAYSMSIDVRTLEGGIKNCTIFICNVQ